MKIVFSDKLSERKKLELNIASSKSFKNSKLILSSAKHPLLLRILLLLLADERLPD